MTGETKQRETVDKRNKWKKFVFKLRLYNTFELLQTKKIPLN